MGEGTGEGGREEERGGRVEPGTEQNPISSGGLSGSECATGMGEAEPLHYRVYIHCRISMRYFEGVHSSCFTVSGCLM